MSKKKSKRRTRRSTVKKGRKRTRKRRARKRMRGGEYEIEIMMEKIFPLDVKKTDTILEVKEKIYEKEGILPKHLRILKLDEGWRRKKELTNEQILGDCHSGGGRLNVFPLTEKQQQEALKWDKLFVGLNREMEELTVQRRETFIAISPIPRQEIQLEEGEVVQLVGVPKGREDLIIFLKKATGQIAVGDSHYFNPQKERVGNIRIDDEGNLVETGAGDAEVDAA
tara:strand:- start:1569 stop:2243 length:675 start_codon:yes stop_codon:yes gene_type:complete